jgi:hypothetical protein
MEKLIKLIDIYGTDFTLRINGDSKYKSVLGGLLTIITLICFTFAVVVFGQDFYLRKTPNISIEDGIFDKNATPILNGTEYRENIIIFKVQKVSEKIIRPAIVSVDNTDNRNEIKLDFLENCDDNFIKREQIINENNQKVKESYIFYCLKLNDYEISYRSYLMEEKPLIIDWISCDDLTEKELKKVKKNTCDKSFNSTIEGIAVAVYYKRIGFDGNNPQPLSWRYLIDLKYFTIDKTTNMKYNLELYELQDDVGWITQNMKKSYDISLKFSKSEEFNYQTPNKKFPAFTYSFSISDENKVFKRSYLKFQDFLAKLGGFMKLVIYVMSNSQWIVKLYLIDEHIIQKVFDSTKQDFSLHSNINPVFDVSSLLRNKSDKADLLVSKNLNFSYQKFGINNISHIKNQGMGKIFFLYFL